MRFPTLIFVAAAASAAYGVSPATDALLADAQKLFNEHHYADARAAFERVLKIDPDNPEANYRVGLFACDAGEWEKALACEERALNHDPNNAKYQYGWGSANGIAALKAGLFSKLGHAHKCISGFRRAAELEPNNPQYRYALFSYYQQAPGFAGGDKDLARKEAAALRKLDPALARQAWALIYITEKNGDAAFREYEIFLRDHPDDYWSLYSCGLIAVFSGQRIEDSIAALRHCLRLDVPAGLPSHADVHYRIATLLEKKNDRRAARAEYVAALKDDANYAAAKHGLEKLGSE